MTIDKVRALCRSLPGVTEDIKWDDDLVFSVGGKMFVVVMLDPPNRLSFKCDPEEWAELIEKDGIIPAPYLARAKWVSLESTDVMDLRETDEHIRRSYALVCATLTAKARALIEASPSPGKARPKVPTRARRPK